MLSKSDLERFKSTLGLNIWQVERDYLQHLILMFSSRHTGNELIFKGGTALQKVYGLNRFSIDLDFTKNNTLDIESTFDKVVKDMSNFGFVSNLKFSKGRNSEALSIKINGPLYDGTEKTTAVLKIEISLRENVILPPESKEIFPVYEDLSPYFVTMMKLEEILAEKIRAIFWRAKARHVYDLWFLLGRNVAIDTSLINKKLSYYKLSFSLKEFANKLKEVEKIWENDLEQVLTFVPDFKKTTEEILSKFQSSINL